jgi:hypothetical protein
MRRITLFIVALLAFTLPVSGVAFADSTSDYNSKVSAAQAKVASAQAKLVSAQAVLNDLKVSSNGEAELLASAQSAVTLAKDELTLAASSYSTDQTSYNNALSVVQSFEAIVDDAVVVVNSAADVVDSAYAAYLSAQSVTDSALSAVNVAQLAYDGSSVTTGGQSSPGLTMRVYNGIQSRGNPPSRSDSLYTLCKTTTVSQINVDWGGGGVAGCNTEYFMIHYTGYITYPTDKSVYFYAQADDGFHMSINGQTLINDWSLKGCSGNTAGVFTFEAGKSYPIDAWMYEWTGGACNILNYQPVGSGQWSVAPASFFSTSPVAVTTKDPALKAVLDAKTAVYVSAVASEEQALTDYENATDVYDSAYADWESKTTTLNQKRVLLDQAETLLAGSEDVWQTKSDAYTDADAILTTRKTRFAGLFESIKNQTTYVDSLIVDLATAKSELAAIPKPVSPPKASQKVVIKPVVVTKVVARPVFVPRPKL